MLHKVKDLQKMKPKELFEIIHNREEPAINVVKAAIVLKDKLSELIDCILNE